MLAKGAPEVATHTRHEIAVYPSRAKLLRYALLYLVVVCFPLCPVYSVFEQRIRSRQPGASAAGSLVFRVDGFFGIMILFIALLRLFTLYRILVRKPSRDRELGRHR